ncbi:Toluene transporter subunit: membrane component of ABC superfamily [Rhodospirillaceae bacterium LM-1]|nr:Toluene transporter subunit: membrane component of ABC superfamily [Rhodospirillaceae bacterium LM-1]
MKKLLLNASMAFALAASCLVDLPASASEVANGAKSFVAQLSDRAVNQIGKAQVSEEERANRVRALMQDSFDIPRIASFVTGRVGANADAAARKEFEQVFLDYQVYTWTKRFKDYGGQTLVVGNAMPPDESGDVSVDSRLVDPAGKPPVEVTWRVRPEGNSYRGVDIVVEGVSMRITMQSDYRSILQRQGLPGLTAALKERVDGIRTGKIEVPPLKAGSAK